MEAQEADPDQLEAQELAGPPTGRDAEQLEQDAVFMESMRIFSESQDAVFLDVSPTKAYEVGMDGATLFLQEGTSSVCCSKFVSV